MKKNLEISSSAELLAKNKGVNKGLFDHTTAVVDTLEKEISRRSVLIKLLAERYDFSYEDIVKQAQIAAITHDLGKMQTEFQIYIRQENPHGSSGKLHHRLASIPFTINVNKLYANEDMRLNVSVLAVATHHKIFSASSDKMKTEFSSAIKNISINYVNNSIEWAWDYIKSYANKFCWQENLNVEFCSVKCFKKRYIRDIEKYTHEIMKNHIPFLIVKGLLQMSDWQASGQKLMDINVLDNLEKMIEQSTKNRALTRRIIKNEDEFKLSDMQKKMLNTEENTMLISPCGSGKTEAAGLWASNDKQKRQIIYLLPTQVTSNKIYNRFSEIIKDKSTVGLLHSTARYHQTINNNEEQLSDSLKQQISSARAFAKPVTVATVDQALFSTLNGGYWTQSMLRLSDANIILDEIHSYEPYTLGLLVSMIEEITSRNSRVSYISATMPTKLRKFFSGITKNLVEIKGEFSKLPKWKIIDNTNQLLIDKIPEIRQHVQNGKQVLVVANNVAEATHLFNEYNDKESSVLLHSGFMLKDRAERELKVEDISNNNIPFVVFSTQVLEVSIDIDFDILYTELCPIDALIQRLGRVNRYGKKEISNVYVLHPHEKSEKIYDSELLKRSYKELFMGRKEFNLLEEESLNALDAVYNWWSEEENFKTDYNKGYKQSKRIREHLKYVYDLNVMGDRLEVSTRKIDYPKIEVIPQDYTDGSSVLDEYKKTCDDKNGFEMGRGFLVRIPVWWFNKCKIVDELPHGLLVNIKYDKDTGITGELINQIQ